MFDCFKRAWDIEMQKLHLGLDYWYVWLIMFIIFGIIIWKLNRD